MDPVTLAVLALGGFALLGGRRSSAPLQARGAWTMEDRVSMLHEIRSMSIHYSNEFKSMTFLADFLTVTGFRESNFNPRAINPEVKENPENAARGLFGFRPQDILKEANGLERFRSRPNILLYPRWSFVCGVYHIWNACQRLAKAYFTPNFAAVRRWWARPSLVYDYDLIDEKSQSNLYNFEEAIYNCNASYGTDIDPDFIWYPIDGWQNYPGMESMIKIYGLS